MTVLRKTDGRCIDVHITDKLLVTDYSYCMVRIRQNYIITVRTGHGESPDNSNLLFKLRNMDTGTQGDEDLKLD